MIPLCRNAFACRQERVHATNGIVIRQRDCVEALCQRDFRKRGRVVTPVGARGVHVKVYHGDINLFSAVLCPVHRRVCGPSIIEAFAMQFQYWNA